MFLLFLYFMEEATSICSLKKVFTTCGQKNPWVFSMTLTFDHNQLFPQHRFFEERFCMAAPNLKILFWIQFHIQLP